MSLARILSGCNTSFILVDSLKSCKMYNIWVNYLCLVVYFIKYSDCTSCDKLTIVHDLYIHVDHLAFGNCTY